MEGRWLAGGTGKAGHRDKAGKDKTVSWVCLALRRSHHARGGCRHKALLVLPLPRTCSACRCRRRGPVQSRSLGRAVAPLWPQQRRKRSWQCCSPWVSYNTGASRYKRVVHTVTIPSRACLDSCLSGIPGLPWRPGPVACAWCACPFPLQCPSSHRCAGRCRLRCTRLR